MSTVLLVTSGCYAGAVVGIWSGFPPVGIASIWPPTSILLAALLLTPIRTWWMYALVAVVSYLHVAAVLVPAAPVMVMLPSVASNVVLAVIAALGVRRVVGDPPRFDSFRRMAAYIVLAPLLAAAVGGALASLVFMLAGWTSDFWLSWRQRVLGNVFPILTIPPLILLIATGEMIPVQHGQRRRYIELGLLGLGLLAVSVPVFGWRFPGPGNFPALLLAPLPFLLWAAVRLGPGGLCVSLLVVAAVSLAHAVKGHGPFVTRSPAENVLSLQIFLLGISIPLMLLSSLVEERRQAEASLRANRERIGELAGRLISAHEEERRRIARELHDDVNQQVAMLAIGLSEAKLQLSESGAAALRAVSDLQQRTEELARAVHELSHELHPATLERVGLPAALRSLAARSSSPGFHVNVAVLGAAERIPLHIAIGLYRIAQEGTHNAALHSGAKQVDVTLSVHDDTTQLLIRDGGCGFDVQHAQNAGGLGLLSIDERVRLLQGSVEITSEPERGTTVLARVPMKR